MNIFVIDRCASNNIVIYVIIPLPFLLAPDTIVPYVKYHENVFLFEIIKVQRFNTIFDKQHCLTS